MLWVYFALAGGFCPITGWVRKRTPYGVHSRKGASSIARNSFIQISKLHDVRGRIDYISSHARQENQKFIQENPDIPVIELDTVEGGRDNSTQAFLTIFFRNCSLRLIFVLQEKSQDQVIKVFDYLTEKLGIKVFQELFPVILTDNGVEFQFPERLECDKNGEIRTKIFYCNPNSSWQKGRIEKNHEYIRYVIPKSQSLDHYKQRDACVLMNHINSEARDSLNGCTPFRLSKMLLNNRLHRLLCLQEIPGDQVHLKPSLLKK